MTPSQRYYQVMSPGLILVGLFFGFKAMFVVFLPTIYLYYAHTREWTIWQASYRSALIITVICFYAYFT